MKIFNSQSSLKEEFKSIEKGKINRKENLAIINLVAIVIKNGMGILDVSLPKKM